MVHFKFWRKKETVMTKSCGIRYASPLWYIGIRYFPGRKASAVRCRFPYFGYRTRTRRRFLHGTHVPAHQRWTFPGLADCSISTVMPRDSVYFHTLLLHRIIIDSFLLSHQPIIQSVINPLFSKLGE